MNNLMDKIVDCKYCGRPEFYGEMRWLNGKCMCRSCYKFEYEQEYRKSYIWDDLDGERPSLKELYEQEGCSDGNIEIVQRVE